MIERFNFYDLYGYAFPGLALLAVLAIPFGLLQPFPHPEGVEAAVLIAAVAVFAYFVGHLMATFGAMALPSSPQIGTESFPYSTTMLDPGDPNFSKPFKEQVARRVQAWFGLDVAIGKKADRELSAVRQNAFIMARTVVNESSAYGEQQEGMYVLTRGLAIACLVGVAYTAGWAVSPRGTPRWDDADVLVFAVAALWVFIVSAQSFVPRPRLNRMAAALGRLRPVAAARKRVPRLVERSALAALALAFLALGYFFGRPHSLSRTEVLELSALALAYAIGFARFYGAYIAFAQGFARTVWNHFGAEPPERPDAKKTPANG